MEREKELSAEPLSSIVKSFIRSPFMELYTSLSQDFEAGMPLH